MRWDVLHAVTFQWPSQDGRREKCLPWKRKSSSPPRPLQGRLSSPWMSFKRIIFALMNRVLFGLSARFVMQTASPGTVKPCLHCLPASTVGREMWNSAGILPLSQKSHLSFWEILIICSILFLWNVHVTCPGWVSLFPSASRFPSSFPLFSVSLLSFVDSLTRCQSCGLVLHRAFLSSCLKSPHHHHTVAFPKCSEDCSRICSAVCPQISSGLWGSPF